MFKKIIASIPWEKILKFAIKQGIAYAKEDARYRIFEEVYFSFARDILIEAAEDSETTVDDVLVEQLDKFMLYEDINVINAD